MPLLSSKIYATIPPPDGGKRGRVIAHFYDDTRIIPDAPGGWSGPGGSGGMSDFLAWVQSMLRADDTLLPVGPIYTAVDWTGGIIPELVSGDTVAEALDVPGTIDRRDTPSDETQLPFVNYWPDPNEAGKWCAERTGEFAGMGAICGLTDSGLAIMRAEAGELVGTGAGTSEMDPSGDDIPPITGGTDMAWYDDLDTNLGLPNLWGPGGDFSNLLPGFNTPMLPTVQPGAGVVTLPPNGGGGGVPGGGACPVIPPGYYMNKFGCLVKRKKRRRKQLLTARDAAQLGQLLSLAGKSSEISKTWIATHS